ncbi:MAG TPA: ester cyclase [Thermoanaerobaculia bacterium]|nr:ester cyclase [Thermoanaerobaculia bacterium]
MSETNKALVLRLIDEAQCKGNLAVVDELFADDFVDHTPFPGVPPTRDGVKMLFGYLRSAFPDLHVHVQEQIAEGDKVATRKVFTGTHGGEFMGAPPTNRTVSFEVIDILTLRGERITEHRVIFDSAAVRQQLV